MCDVSVNFTGKFEPFKLEDNIIQIMMLFHSQYAKENSRSVTFLRIGNRLPSKGKWD